ncbi:signal peptidase II [bacterium]|nr:signal peptidase II [bacterium]|tara:strand:- start:134 stop:610 length:477 start_codon:yes stop_codon:yes gene_type:complete
MNKKTLFFVLPSLVVLMLDQITKSIAVAKLEPSDPIELFWTLQLNLIRNAGASFSIGRNLTPVIATIAIIASVVIAYLGLTETNLKIKFLFGVVFGGVLGNVADRIFRRGDGFLSGEVVDFIDLQWWPIFNFADVALVVGLPLLLYYRYQVERDIANG